MRTLIVILLIPIFAVIFLIAITLNQVASTLSDEDLIVRILDDVEIYDYFYDELMVLLSADLLDREYEVNFYGDNNELNPVLKLDHPDGDPLGFKVFFDDVIPREYLRQEIRENLGVMLAYLNETQDTFIVDLGVQNRIREIPPATDRLMKSTLISDELVNDLVFPVMVTFNTEILQPTLGLGFDAYELEQIAFVLFDPDWIDHHVVSGTNMLAPYLAHDADEFQFIVRVEDRIVIAGEIMKSKLSNDDILYRLVFTRMVRPLLGQALGMAQDIGFGMTLSNQEVVDVMEAIAPRTWVNLQGDGLIDELTAYLVNADNEIDYNISMKERKEAAVFVVTELVMSQLREALTELSTCQSLLQIKAASEDVGSRKIPSCIPGGISSIDPIINSLDPIMRMEVENFISQQIPDDLHYSHAFFQQAIGDNMSEVENVRKNISDGIEFSDDDLLNALAWGGFYRQSQIENADLQTMSAEDLVALITDGIMWTDVDFIDGLDESSKLQVENLRQNLGTAISFRWLIWLAILLPVFLLVYFTADNWPSRLKLGGAIISIMAVLSYAGITFLWDNYSDQIHDQYLPQTYELGVRMEADLPSLADELKDNGPVTKLFEILEVWQEQLKNQTIPWIFLGVFAFAIGTSWVSRSSSRREPLTLPEKIPVTS